MGKMLHFLKLCSRFVFLIKNKLYIKGILSTQRNESINNALKKRIKHFKRTNVIRIISIVSDMFDQQYHKVSCKYKYWLP